LGEKEQKMGVREGGPSTGESDVIVGYALTEKKCRSLFSPELIDEARSKGVHFLPIDPSRPIEDQAGHPFDVVLQKVPASSPHKKEWDERIEAYASSNPDAYVVDLPSAVRRVANRETMLDAVRAVASSAKRIVDLDSCVVRAPKQIVAVAGTEQQVRAQVDAASLRFPLLAKSLRADGSSDSHKVAIIHDEDGLACVARGAVPGLKPPCVIQEYVNHGGCLFKVYVVGEDVTMTRRKSLPDLRGARRASRRRKAAAEKAAAELAAARGEGPAATRDARGAKPRVPVGGVGGKKEDTTDVDGDVDDSEEDLDDDEGDEGDEGDGSARRRRRATGAQSVSRVSCFRGGATEGETSWRDRLTEDERRRMSYSPRASAESPLESPSPLRLHQSFARNLTISRVGSVDSIGGASVVSEHPSVGRELDGEGDGSGDSASPTLGTGTGTGRSGLSGLPPLAPGESRRSRDALRNLRSRNGSFGAGSDFTFTTSDGGTESEAGDGGEEPYSPGLRVRAAQDPSFRPETLRERVEPEAPSRESADGKKKFVAAPRDDFVEALALTLRDELGLRLFNFDMIRVDGDKDEFLVVDINYFPGIAKMPGYSDTFCRFLRRAKQKGGRRA